MPFIFLMLHSWGGLWSLSNLVGWVVLGCGLLQTAASHISLDQSRRRQLRS